MFRWFRLCRPGAGNHLEAVSDLLISVVVCFRNVSSHLLISAVYFGMLRAICKVFLFLFGMLRAILFLFVRNASSHSLFVSSFVMLRAICILFFGILRAILSLSLSPIVGKAGSSDPETAHSQNCTNFIRFGSFWARQGPACLGPKGVGGLNSCVLYFWDSPGTVFSGI